ncbi:unnamed protein product [Caretta caretta]
MFIRMCFCTWIIFIATWFQHKNCQLGRKTTMLQDRQRIAPLLAPQKPSAGAAPASTASQKTQEEPTSKTTLATSRKMWVTSKDEKIQRLAEEHPQEYFCREILCHEDGSSRPHSQEQQHLTSSSGGEGPVETLSHCPGPRCY